jgi:hypothetical protein
LTGGHVADIKGAGSLVSATAPSGRMIGDKGYDAKHLRLFLASRGTIPVIPTKANRKAFFPFDAELYTQYHRAKLLPHQRFPRDRNPL